MNFKKKITALVTTAVCAVTSVGIGSYSSKENEVSAAGLTGLDAFGITSQMTIGWNLGNTLDSTNDNASYDSPIASFVTNWGNPEPTQELFDAIKAGGFNTVRIPTTWYGHLKENGDSWTVDPRWVDYVKDTVDMAYKNDMFVILNVHHENWVNVKEFTEETKAEAASKLRAIWTTASETFKDYDQHLIFEGMNEPRQTGNPNVSEWSGGTDDPTGYSWQYINDLNKVFVDTVRANSAPANQERLLMLPQYDASCDLKAVNAIDVPEGSGNVALSVHAYSPYFFAMATDEYANHEYLADGSSCSGYGENYRESLQNMFNGFKKISEEKKAPIILGECNASDFHNTESRINWAHDFFSFAKDAGVPCVLWDNDAPLAADAEGTGENHYYICRRNNLWYEEATPVLKAILDTVGVTGYTLPEYVRKPFSWADMQVGDDWVELFKSEEGKACTGETGEPYEWGSVEVNKALKYINKDYKIVMFAESLKNPDIVLMGKNWNSIGNDGKSQLDYVYYYDFNDMKSVVEAGESLDDVTNFFCFAKGAPTTVYGLYAVPLTPDAKPNGEGGSTTPEFSWDKVIIPFDWVEIFKSEAGEPTVDYQTGEPGEWGNIEIKGGADYLNSSYTIVLVASSAKTPEIVLMGSEWNRIAATEKLSDFMFKFAHDDIVKTVTGSGDTMEAASEHLYASAAGAVADIYGVYAVPEGAGVDPNPGEVTTTTEALQPAETTTTTVTTEAPAPVETTTTTEEPAPPVSTEAPQPTPPASPTMLGDVNLDNEVGIADVVIFGKYLTSSASYPLSSDVAKANADVNKDGMVDTLDLNRMIEFCLGKLTQF